MEKILMPENYQKTYNEKLLIGYKHLIKKIPTHCQIFLIEGIEKAISRLPVPNNFVLKYKFQLTGNDTILYKEMVDKLLLSRSKYMDLELIISDSLYLLSQDEYRVFYDYDICEAINNCYPTDDENRLKLYRHLCLFRKILNINTLHNIDLKKFHEVFSKHLYAQQQKAIDMFYGLSSGYPKTLHEVEDLYKSDCTYTDAIIDISNGIYILEQVKDEFVLE